MRLIKLGLISFVVIFLIVFLISLLMPSHVRISRAVNIAAKQDRLAASLQSIDAWYLWNEAVKNAQPMEYIDREKKQLVGKNLEITLVRTTADSVFTVWRNHNGKEIAGNLSLQQAGNVTIVQYYFDFHQKWYPWEKFASINLDKQWGPSMEKSLENLKKLFEQNQ